jgi:preprotein translocase subunit Sss1
MPTDAEFEMSRRINAVGCVIFGAVFLILAIADLFKGTGFFHRLLGG